MGRGWRGCDYHCNFSLAFKIDFVWILFILDSSRGLPFIRWECQGKLYLNKGLCFHIMAGVNQTLQSDCCAGRGLKSVFICTVQIMVQTSWMGRWDLITLAAMRSCCHLVSFLLGSGSSFLLTKLLECACCGSGLPKTLNLEWWEERGNTVIFS